MKKILCSLGIHHYPKIRATRVIEIIPIILTSLVEAYGYGKCKRCGKGQRFYKSGEYFSLGEKPWKKITKEDRRTLKQQIKWWMRNF